MDWVEQGGKVWAGKRCKREERKEKRERKKI